VSGGLPAGRVTAVWRGAGEIRERLDLPPGELGETLVVTGLPLAELVVGTRLRVGEAVVELIGAGPPASGGGLVDADEADARRAARVVEGGAIRPGAPVTIEAVPVPLEDALDLHPFTPSEVTDVVAEYLARAHVAGLHEVRLIHGRGRGVQREAVRRLLAASPLVVAFGDAPAERGGWGATIARLRQ
jgi:Smr domain/MOSC domain